MLPLPFVFMNLLPFIFIAFSYLLSFPKSSLLSGEQPVLTALFSLSDRVYLAHSRT